MEESSPLVIKLESKFTLIQDELNRALNNWALMSAAHVLIYMYMYQTSIPSYTVLNITNYTCNVCCKTTVSTLYFDALEPGFIISVEWFVTAVKSLPGHCSEQNYICSYLIWL